MLPASEGWRPLHPLSPLLRSGQFIVIGAVAASQSLDFVLGTPLLALAGFIVFVVFASIYGYIAWRFMGYRVTDEHIEVRLGVIFRSHKRVPRARIESIDIARPLLARVAGLSEVRVEVASSNESQLKLRFLSEDDAETLRHMLLRANVSVPADVSGDEVDSETGIDQVSGATDTTVASVNFNELFVATVVPPVIALAFFAALGFVSVGVMSLIFGDSVVIGFGGVFALVVPAIGLGVRLASQLLSLHGFTISENDQGLLIRRGLLNLLTQKVPLARVQAVRIDRPLLWRPFGRERLIVDVAGYRGQNDAAVTSVLMPICDRATTARILDRVLPGISIDDMNFLRAPEAAKFRSPFAYEFYAVAMNDRFIASVGGVLNRRVDVIPHRKVQSLRITQGPWQRSLGLASLHVDSAGDNIAVQVFHREEQEARNLVGWSRTAQENGG